MVIWSVLSQFKWPLLFLHHAWRGRGTRLGIRTKHPNNHSDTESGTLSITQRLGKVSPTLFFVHLVILLNRPQLLPLPSTLSKTNQHCRRVHCQLKARPSMIQAGAWPEMGLLQLAASSSLRPARQLLLPSPVSLFTFSHRPVFHCNPILTFLSTRHCLWICFCNILEGDIDNWSRESRKSKCLNQINSCSTAFIKVWYLFLVVDIKKALSDSIFRTEKDFSTFAPSAMECP